MPSKITAVGIAIEIPEDEQPGGFDAHNRRTAELWIAAAGIEGCIAFVTHLPIDDVFDLNGAELLALIDVGGQSFVLTLSEPYGLRHTIHARPPVPGELLCFRAVDA